MIDTVTFENAYGERLMPYEQYGIWMKSHSVSPPNPVLHRFALDGADGEIDLSEWAGEVKFESRKIEIGFRDMNEDTYRILLQFALGRMLKIMFSDDPECYYHGRCDSTQVDTNRRVSDVTMTFVCDPYRMMRTPTHVTLNSPGSAILKARRMAVVPTITALADCSVTFGGETYSITQGAHTYDGIRITDRPQTMTATGSSVLDISWTDGVL